METKLAPQIREEMVKAEAEAKTRWQEFSQARDAAAKEGHNLADKDGAAFQALDEKHRAYSEAAQLAGDLKERFVSALQWDGDGPPPEGGKSADDETRTKGIVTAGQKITSSDDYKAAIESGVFSTSGKFGQVKLGSGGDREQFKALLTGLSSTSAGALIENDRQAGLLALLLRPISIRDLVTVGDTDSDVVEWVRETAFTNAAAETAEATATAGASGTKPESGITYDVVQSNVVNIAHWIPATKRALADVGQLRTLIDQRLRDGVALRLDSQMISGDATGENLRGILNTAGIGVQSGTGMPIVEALLRAITTVRLGFLEPNAILMHPTDFMEMRLATNANGDYLYGPPNLVGPAQAWGLPIVQSTVIPQNSALVGKWDEAVLYMREGVTISASDSHSDFFVRNMVAVLAESRMAFTVPRPVAFTQVTNI